jgi:hypothetical protein
VNSAWCTFVAGADSAAGTEHAGQTEAYNCSLASSGQRCCRFLLHTRSRWEAPLESRVDNCHILEIVARWAGLQRSISSSVGDLEAVVVSWPSLGDGKGYLVSYYRFDWRAKADYLKLSSLFLRAYRIVV